MKNKYVEATAKILSKVEDGYILGFECPKCDTGIVTTKATPPEGETWEPGQLVDVKISQVTLTDGMVSEIKLLDPTKKMDFMPDITAKLKEMGQLIEVTANTDQNTEIKPSQYTIVAKHGNNIYSIKDNQTEDMFVAMSDHEFEIDMLADKKDFSRLSEEAPMGDFTLMKHWWGDGKTFSHFDLFMHDGKGLCHMVFDKNPIDEIEMKAIQREPYSDNFWQKAKDKMELINPGDPGNPSNDVCAVEGLDEGKLAIYESFEDANGIYHLRIEFFGQMLSGRWTLSSSVQNVWHATKETMKLSEELPMEICLKGDIGGFEETPQGLKVKGTAISFGVWNGFYFSPEVLAASPVDDFKNMIIDQEHKRNEVAGVVTKYSLDGPDINVETMITDYEAIEKIKRGEYTGFSIDANVMGDPVRRLIMGVKKYVRLTVCKNPACKTCYFAM